MHFHTDGTAACWNNPHLSAVTDGLLNKPRRAGSCGHRNKNAELLINYLSPKLEETSTMNWFPFWITSIQACLRLPDPG